MSQVEDSRTRDVEQETAIRPGGQAATRGDARVARLVGPAHGSANHHVLDPAMVEIRPEPSLEERAAILLAVEQMLRATSRADPPACSAWASAGRHEAQLERMGGSGSGWGRGSSRLADW